MNQYSQANDNQLPSDGLGGGDEDGGGEGYGSGHGYGDKFNCGGSGSGYGRGYGDYHGKGNGNSYGRGNGLDDGLDDGDGRSPGGPVVLAPSDMDDWMVWDTEHKLDGRENTMNADEEAFIQSLCQSLKASQMAEEERILCQVLGVTKQELFAMYKTPAGYDQIKAAGEQIEKNKAHHPCPTCIEEGDLAACCCNCCCPCEKCGRS